ncbi:hypothetical protein HDE_01104 [Halotydeus destructor]|nr:hypothetical protein HDE_01104 [Halotydeus destructor]
MTSERTKRIFTFLTFFVCTACLVCLTASLATHNWLTARPIRLTTINGSSQLLDDDDGTGKFRGTINLGLFQGTKVLNYGFGDRVSTIWIKEELLRNPSLMPFGLWLFTVMCCSIAILFGLISSIFGIINTVMTPIETITGLHGLYLWNGMGALFCMSSCLSWLIQFRTKLRRNVLSPEEQNDGWSSEGRASLGFSFFLVTLAMVLYLFNIFLVSLASRRPWRRTTIRTVSDKNPEGVIMLY